MRLSLILLCSYIVIGGNILLPSSLFAQEEVKHPILLDKSVLSGVGLEKIDIKSEPEKDFYQKNLYKGDDISVYVVSTETWNNRMDNFPFDEFIYMYHGEAIVKPDHGRSQVFQSGDYFFAHKGFTGEWEIKSGDLLHYELSVIATQRADSSAIIKGAAHRLFDKSIISGAHITIDESRQYTEVLEQGAELTVSLHAEPPTSRDLISSKEMMIRVLSGQITIESSDSTNQTFYSGDFFVIPKGLNGAWKSEGHGITKYLSIEKST